MCRPKENIKRSVKNNATQPMPRGPVLDFAYFCVPALFFSVTNILPIYIIGVLRILTTHVFLAIHYVTTDKDNYTNKLSQKQLHREQKDYLVGIVLHMWAQVVLQLFFPGMFFTETSAIKSSIWNTIISHVLVVEPLYYVVHRWLHIPEHMKAMHGFHHMSVNTVPATSLVQNFEEHFLYIATFGPAMLLPYFVGGKNHWLVVGLYLILFDVANAYGHTNFKFARHWIFESKWSPLRYLFYTPDFHLGHHALYNYNYGLFMPIWDHLLGTFRDYKKPDPKLLPSDQQDFVFIGHSGGLGHFFSLPEFSVYNVYGPYLRTFLPIEVEWILARLIMGILKLFFCDYKVSRYQVANKYIGRIISIVKTPLDYMSSRSYSAINADILNVVRSANKDSGTRYFGLGNLNKMKQLNDGGQKIVEMIATDKELKDKNIRIWTGDTLTSASVFYQVMEIPKLKKVYYIGANGKIGRAVCTMLAEKNIAVCIYSKYTVLEPHPLITYSTNLSDMVDYKYVLVGKHLPPAEYEKALGSKFLDKAGPSFEGGSRYLLDYTVPFMPLQVAQSKTNSKYQLKDESSNTAEIHHLQVGLLKVDANNSGEKNTSAFLKGAFDVSMGTDENCIYPCHAGCILNMVSKREENEVGEICLDDIAPMWKKAQDNGLNNFHLQYDDC